MNTREKLIELIRKADKEDYTSATQDQHYEFMADNLIANGVTVQRYSKWVFVNGRCGCNTCRKCLSYDGNGVILDLSDLPYCPWCGAEMDLED